MASDYCKCGTKGCNNESVIRVVSKEMCIKCFKKHCVETDKEAEKKKSKEGEIKDGVTS